MIINIKPYKKKIKWFKTKTICFKPKNFKLVVKMQHPKILSHRELEELKLIARLSHKKFPKHKLIAIQTINKREIIMLYKSNK